MLQKFLVNVKKFLRLSDAKNSKKIEKGLWGSIVIPSDKSISHRAVMFSSIAKGECIIRNFSSGADCHSTLNLFKQLGVDIQFLDNKTLKN